MRKKKVIYLSNNYIATLKELQEAIEKNYNGREGKSFRKELLAYYKDQVLVSWLEEHGCKNESNRLPLWEEGYDTLNNDVFKVVYEAIMNKECSSELDSAFSQQAELLRCEVDGEHMPIRNNTITMMVGGAKELKLVFKALEEIDSFMKFQIEKLNSKKIIWPQIKTENNSYSKGSEFSISFSLSQLGKKNEGSYIVRRSNDVVCNLELLNNTIEIEFPLQNSRTLKLYPMVYKHYVFYITNPEVMNWEKNKQGLIEDCELDKLNNVIKPHRLRFATKREIEGLISGPISSELAKIFLAQKGLYYPFVDEAGTKWYWDGFGNEKERCDRFYFVAVLDQ